MISDPDHKMSIEESSNMSLPHHDMAQGCEAQLHTVDGWAGDAYWPLWIANGPNFMLIG